MDDVGAQAVELLAELVAIDSVNPGLVPGAAGERRIVEHLQRRLERAGFACTVITPPGQDDRPSLLAVAPGPAQAPMLVLNGHLDTVGVAGMSAPFTPRIEGERLAARGAADMKGGVAAAVAAAERLAATGAPVRPVLALVADEEDASLGSEATVAALPALGIRPAACLVVEPTDLALCRSLRGFAVVRVRFEGRAAHSSQAEQGINAVTHLGRFLHALEMRAPAVRARGGDLMATVVRGGDSAFVVPDHAECLVELRSSPDDDAGAGRREVGALLRPEWRASVEVVTERTGWRLSPAGPAASLAAALGTALGTGATFDAPYWMEAPLWESCCPTLVCGPSGGGLHAVDEWVDLSQVRRLAAALVDVLSSWRPGPPGRD